MLIWSSFKRRIWRIAILNNRREIIKMLGGCSKKGVDRNCPKMPPIISIFKRRKYKIWINLLKYCISRRMLRSPNKIRNGSIISLERSKTIKKYSNISKIQSKKPKMMKIQAMKRMIRRIGTAISPNLSRWIYRKKKYGVEMMLWLTELTRKIKIVMNNSLLMSPHYRLQ